jgi:3-hydroxyacyl-CoA dehydrogenase/enoyl-CoA hydratase/3-hydroxybutyryl-CoA epimerase
MLESAEAGFLAESAAIATLAEHPVTAELMRLFFLREDAKSPPSDLTLPIRPDSIVQAAVIGAGQMGAGIARLLAERAIWVRLKDTKPEYVARGIASLRKAMATELGRRRITPLQATQTLDHVSPTTDYRGMRHAEIVIEAVVEDLSIKQQVFRELAEVTDPRTVLATNTSSLLVSEIATGVPHPERVVGLHFFNPPHQMPLVEVVRTAQTSPEALASALALVQRIGKTAVVVRDSAGFLVNRLLVPYLNEVGYLLAEVSDPMEIERAAIAFGFPMGPLELTDLVGIEVAAHVAENMHRAFGPRMTPAPLWSRLEELHRQNRGRTGKLVQRTWRGGRRLDPVAARMLAKIRRETGQRKTSTYAWDALIERLVYPVVNEAAHCLEERIIEKPEHVDLAMVFGTGFAPFRGGPLRFADRVGLERIVDRLDRWATDHPRLTPCDLLRRLAAQRRGFLDPLPGHSPAAVA